MCVNVFNIQNMHLCSTRILGALFQQILIIILWTRRLTKTQLNGDGSCFFVQQNKYLPAIVDKETLQYGYLSCGIQIKRFYSGNPFK